MADPVENAINAEHSRQEREWNERMATPTTASDDVSQLAQAIWNVRCPGIRQQDEDVAHYEDAARAAIAALTRPAGDVSREAAAYFRKAAADAKELGSGSDFNQGVVRGLEIAAAQIENGHAALSGAVVEREGL